MININETTVAVETSAELKTVLEGANQIDKIYLAKDITLASGISILASKTEVTIDGLYPTDGTGTIHTYTDMNSAGSGDAIGVRSASSVKVTLQNMNVIGRNYYGIIYVAEGTAYQNVVITYKNITYRGPQITYHPSGLSIYQDLNITIEKSDACPANEVAETYQLQIGGKTTINHTATGNSAFWFRGPTSSPYLEILEGADLLITTTRDIAYSTYYLKLIIGKTANFVVNTRYGFFRDNGHQASSILLDTHSNFSVIQTQTNGTNAMLTCRGDFTVNENATLYLQANYSNSAPLIRFYSTSAKWNVNKPKSVILYNQTNAVFTFENATTIDIKTGRIDYWQTSPTLGSTGEIEGKPLYAWNKSTQEEITITATATSSKTTITANNLTEAETQSLPQLDLLQFQTAKTLRLVPSGSLELKSAPTKIEFQRPVIQTDPVILGRKEESMQIEVIDGRVISKEWYLYAYIDSELKTSDGKYSLPNSLIFMEADGNIHTLGKEPTLVYTGVGNEGMAKTTIINWSQKQGILFKVIEPLYNGETYSAEIHWMLVEEEIT